MNQATNQQNLIQNASNMEEVFKATFDDSEITAKLDALEKQIHDIGVTSAKTGDVVAASMKEAATATQQFDTALDQAAQDTARTARAVDTAQKANQGWLNSIRQTIAGQQVAGQSLGEWAEQARNFAARITDSAGATGKASAAMRIFSTVLKGLGIGVLIAAIGSLINYLSKFQPLLDKASQISAGFGAAIDVVAKRVIALGSAFGKLFSGDFSGAWDTAAQAVSGFGEELANAAVEAYNLEQRLQALRDITITQSVEAARARVELEKFRQVADDGTRSINERAKAARQAGEIEKELAEQAVDRALEAQQIAQRQFALDRDNLAKREEAAKKEVEFQEAIAALNAANFNAEKEQREFRKEAAEARKKQQEEELKRAEQLRKDLDALRAEVEAKGIDRDLAEVEKKYNDLQRVAAEGVEALLKIEKRRALTPEELAKLKELGKIQVQLEEQRTSALVDVVASYAEKDIEIEEQLRASKEALAKKDYDLSVKSLENAKALRDQETAILEQQFANFIGVLEETGIKEEDIAKRREELARTIQRARLESELQFQTELLEIAKVGDTEAVSQIENTIKLIKEKLKGLLFEGEPGRKTLLESLGLDEKEIDGLKEAGRQVIDSLQQIADARVQAAEEVTRARQKDLQEAQDFLIRQQELAAEGLANDTDLAKQEVERQRELRDAALKEEAKARRAQVLLDTVGQVSALITSSANIFKSLSPLGPFGIGIAIATIATMFGAFAKAKADALKSASVPKFRKGTKLEGRSHEAGGLAISDEHGNVVGEAEGDEWLIGTRPSREHDRFLERLNKGEFAGVNLDALFRPGTSNPLTEAAPRIERIEKEFREIRETQHTAALTTAYYQAAADIVRAIEEKEVVTPLTNYRVMKKRGRNTYTKIVREEKRV